MLTLLPDPKIEAHFDSSKFAVAFACIEATILLMKRFLTPALQLLDDAGKLAETRCDCAWSP